MKYFSRRRARECAMQAIYSWQISNNNVIDIEHQFLKNFDISGVDIIYFHKLYTGVTKYIKELDILIQFYISFRLIELHYIEKSILRVALFELSKCQDIPYKIVINEAIELTKIFGGTEYSYKFINKILDSILPYIRIPTKQI